MEKLVWNGPIWGRELFFPTNPDLADILGRMDLNFEDFYFFDFLDPIFLDFQIPGFPDSSCHLVIFVRGGSTRNLVQIMVVDIGYQNTAIESRNPSSMLDA